MSTIRSLGIALALAFAPTLAAAEADTFQPEPGFVSLFNGRDLTGWGYAGATPESFDGKTISADGRYEAVNGTIRVNERVPRLIQQASTRQAFPNDFVLRLEFRAGVGGDSGVFVRGIQVQCRDYFAVGPFYDVTRYRPQEWNTIEITVKGTLLYATCNGQVLEPSLRIPATGTIGLEGDLGVMEFRRIRIKELGPTSAGHGATPATVAARAPRIDPTAFNRPIRVAVLGDEITQPSTGFTTTMGRGGIVLADASARQQAAANALVAGSARLTQAVTDARTALAAASLVTPADATDMADKAGALAAAEQALALSRADVFAWLQASPQRLDPTLVAALVPQVTGGGRAGGRGGAAAATPGMVQPTDFPSQLGATLGERWDVRNFGAGGATISRSGDASYWNQPALDAALAFVPDAVVIVLGTNDSRPGAWRADTFVSDYKSLIATFAALPARPAIWIAKPPPAFTTAGGVAPAVISGPLASAIDTIARDTGVGVIDLFAPMRSSAHLTLDGVRPDPEGAKALATAVHAALTVPSSATAR